VTVASGGTPDGRPATGSTPGARGGSRRLRVVALGGGHGLGASLRALCRAFPDQATVALTAVVTVADNGGSSGRLRTEFPAALPPGDLRMALAALCPPDSPWVPLLQHRFTSGGPLDGHALGNLLLLAAWEAAGEPVAALDTVVGLVGARGRVLPMSAVPLDVHARVRLDDGRLVTVRGQAAVARPPGRIEVLAVEPADPPACAAAVAAVTAADVVLLGPGSWFTSVLVHLLVPDLAAALVATQARVVVALNVGDDGETAGLAAADQLALVHAHAPGLRVDTVLADGSLLAPDRRPGVGRPPDRAGAAGDVRAAAAALGARVFVGELGGRRADGRRTAEHDSAAFADALRCVIDTRCVAGSPPCP